MLEDDFISQSKDSLSKEVFYRLLFLGWLSFYDSFYTTTHGYPFCMISYTHTHTPAQTYMQVLSPSCIVKVATCFPIFSLFVPYAWNYLLFIGWECELFGSWTLKVKYERACFAWSLQRSPVNKCSHAGNCSIQQLSSNWDGSVNATKMAVPTHNAWEQGSNCLPNIPRACCEISHSQNMACPYPL